MMSKGKGLHTSLVPLLTFSSCFQPVFFYPIYLLTLTFPFLAIKFFLKYNIHKESIEIIHIQLN